METWPSRFLEELPIRIVDGDRSARYPKRAEFQDDGVVFLNSANIVNNHIQLLGCNRISEQKYAAIRKGRVQHLDIVMTTRGSIGKVALIRRRMLDRALINAEMLLMRTDASAIDPSFLFYVTCSDRFQRDLHNFASGSAQPQIPITDLRRMSIPVPPIAVQRKIAAILSAYDNLIENNLRRIKILEEMAQNLYREWFVEFRFPGHQRARFTDSPLGRIPDQWEPSIVGRASSLISRGPSLKYTERDGIPVLNQRCVRDGEISLDAVQHAEPLSMGKSHLYLQQYDILINSMGVGTLGRVSRNVSILEKMIVHNCITVVRPDPFRVSVQQLFYCLRDNQARFESLGVGATGQTSLRPETIAETPIVLPTAEVSRQFSNLVLPFWDEVGVLKRRNEILRRTRDLLLPRLISGEVDVLELEIAVPDEAGI